MKQPPVPAPDRLAAGVVPVRAGGMILLQLRDDRPNLASPNCWGPLGGMIEPGETPEQAAHREIIEETGRALDRLHYAGYADARNAHGLMVRSHMFGAAVDWTLDDVLMLEGQFYDWFTREQALRLSLAAAVIAPVALFLDSAVYRTLATRAPVQPLPVLHPLPPSLPSTLGLRPGHLLAVQGATAGFVRRLRGLIPGVRITASPAAHERPNVTLWWPQSVTDFHPDAWRASAAPGALLWRMDGVHPSALLAGRIEP